METSCLYPVSVVSKVIVRDLGVLTSYMEKLSYFNYKAVLLCYFLFFFVFRSTTHMARYLQFEFTLIM